MSEWSSIIDCEHEYFLKKICDRSLCYSFEILYVIKTLFSIWILPLPKIVHIRHSFYQCASWQQNYYSSYMVLTPSIIFKHKLFVWC